MLVRIEGRDLPGRSCAAAPGFPGYDNIHVGVQRRGNPAELLDLHAGDAREATWTFAATVGPDGDVRGPYVQGGPGARFVYLSWGSVDAAGNFAMFRRAKLMLEDVDRDVLAAAQQQGVLIARLGLTDPKGHPICARVRPPVVSWTAEPG